jgi:hypothetical protein
MDTNMDFLILPLITSVATIMSTASIQTFPNRPDGMCIYSGVVSYPVTSSCATKMVRKSYEKVEKYLDQDENDSQIIDGPNNDCLPNILYHKNNLMGIFYLYIWQ